MVTMGEEQRNGSRRARTDTELVSCSGSGDTGNARLTCCQARWASRSRRLGTRAPCWKPRPPWQLHHGHRQRAVAVAPAKEAQRTVGPGPLGGISLRGVKAPVGRSANVILSSGRPGRTTARRRDGRITLRRPSAASQQEGSVTPRWSRQHRAKVAEVVPA